MTTAKPPARYGAMWGARPRGFALPSYTTTEDTTFENLVAAAIGQPSHNVPSSTEALFVLDQRPQSQAISGLT
ncbi:hypothetical protein [Bradyrhizobium nanningense]|uniref:hypothetical protein n=1 Tax=Bradyrhizobium nanningense TaxID=1325118 RepID=UPI001008A4A0|nr:hypothetical protein [Bradyrhizobium nanningense]